MGFPSLSNYEHTRSKQDFWKMMRPWMADQYIFSALRFLQLTKFTCSAPCGAVAPRVLGPARQRSLRPAKRELG